MHGETSISLILCSSIRWYYKTNLSLKDSIISQYYLTTVLLKLIHTLHISPLSLAITINNISKSIQKSSNTDEMELDFEENLILQSKPNDIIFSYLFNYIINLFHGFAIFSNKKQIWTSKLENSNETSPIKTLKQNISKNIPSNSISKDFLREQIQNLNINQRLSGIMDLYSCVEKIFNFYEYISFFYVDFILFQSEFKKFQNNEKILIHLPSNVLLSSTIQFISNDIVNNISNQIDIDTIKQIIFLILYHISSIQPNEDLIDYYLLFLSKINVNNITNDINLLIINTLYQNKKANEFFFTTNEKSTKLTISMAKLSLKIIPSIKNEELQSQWKPILDFYGNQFIKFLKTKSINKKNPFISIIIELLFNCYELCSTNLIHQLIENLLLSMNHLHENEKIEFRKLCFHMIEKECSYQSKYYNEFFCKLLLISDCRFKILNSKDKNHENHEILLPDLILEQLIHLCLKNEPESEFILLQVLLLFLSPPNPKNNNKKQTIIEIQSLHDECLLFTSWINHLNAIKSSILSILIINNKNYQNQFEKYCLQLKIKKKLKKDDLILFFNENKNLFKILYSFLSAFRSNINKDLLNHLFLTYNDMFKELLQLSADLPHLQQDLSVNDKSNEFIHDIEEIIAPLYLLFISILKEKNNDILNLTFIEKQIKELMSQRKGTFSPNSISVIENIISIYVEKSNDNLIKANAFSSKFIFYLMNCTMNCIHRGNDNNNLKIDCYIDILCRQLSWCNFPEDNETLAESYRSVFLGFVRALFKHSFTSPKTLNCIRKLLNQLLKPLARNNEEQQDEKKQLQIITEEKCKMNEELQILLIKIHEMITAHSKFIPILLEHDTNLDKESSLEDIIKDEDINILEESNNRYSLVCLLNIIYSYLPSSGFTDNLLKIYACSYHASLHPMDQQILGIICSFEDANISMSTIGYVWGNSQKKLIQTQESIQLQTISQLVTEGELIQYKQLLSTCFEYHSPSEESKTTKGEIKIETKTKYWKNYDPRFLLPFLGHTIEFFDIDTRRLIESGIIPFALISISNKYPRIRKWAYFILSGFYNKLVNSRFPEKMQILVLMNLLRNSIVQENQCISAVIGTFFCKSLIILLHPDHYLYKNINKFLLHRPVIDLDDIPMFFDIMNIITDENQYQKRNWMLDNLNQSLHRYRDYKLFKRRNVIGILTSLFDGISVDNHTRENLFQIIKKSCENTRILIDLIENHSIISWLQFHVKTSPNYILQIIMSLLHHGERYLSKSISSFSMIFNLFSCLISDQSIVTSFIVPLFNCLDKFLQVFDNFTGANNKVQDSLFHFSDSILISLCDSVNCYLNDNENILLPKVMCKLIIRMHSSKWMEFANENVTKRLLNDLFYYQWKMNQNERNNDFTILLPETIQWVEKIITLKKIKLESASLEWLRSISLLVINENK